MQAGVFPNGLGLSGRVYEKARLASSARLPVGVVPQWYLVAPAPRLVSGLIPKER